MNTLQRYIFGRIALFTAGSFAAVLSVVWVTQILTRIDFTTISAQSLSSFLSAVVLLTPQLIALLLPVALVIGMVQVFTTMNSDSEMAVMSAAGVSRAMVAKPVMIMAMIVSLFVLVSNHFIEPRAGRTLRDVLVVIRTDLLANFLQEGVFTKLENGLTIYVDRRLPGNGLGGIMVSDTRDANAELIYYAQSGVIGKVNGNDVLVMTNGQVHNKRSNGDGLSVIRFNSYAIALSQFGSAGTTDFYRAHERETLDLLYPDPNDTIAKTRPQSLRAEFHRRMTDWLYPILFAMVGLVVAGQTQSHRQQRISAFGLAIGGALLYKGGAYAIDGFNKATLGFLWTYYAFPLAGIALNIFFYWRGITVTVPKTVVRAFDGLVEAARKLRVRHARARAA